MKHKSSRRQSVRLVPPPRGTKSGHQLAMPFGALSVLRRISLVLGLYGAVSVGNGTAERSVNR